MSLMKNLGREVAKTQRGESVYVHVPLLTSHGSWSSPKDQRNRES